MSMLNICSLIRMEIEREKKLLEYMNSKRKLLAPGSLQVREEANDSFCYQIVYSEEGKYQIYLDKDRTQDRKIIKELMEKKTLVHAMPLLRGNIAALEKCAVKLREYSPLNYEYGEYLGQEYYLDGDVCYRDWQKKPDSQNTAFPENRIHETKSGKMVRSKSEVLIADTLFDLGIDFKYEPKLSFNGKIRYPDFEIFHPKEKRLIWWEHLGKLDDPGYVCTNVSKLSDFGKEGIRPGNNLIITWETKELPLTHRDVDRELRYFGLL